MLNPAQTMAKLRRLSVGTTPEAQTAAQLLRKLAEKYPEITADGEVVQRDLDVPKKLDLFDQALLNSCCQYVGCELWSKRGKAGAVIAWVAKGSELGCEAVPRLFSGLRKAYRSHLEVSACGWLGGAMPIDPKPGAAPSRRFTPDQILAIRSSQSAGMTHRPQQRLEGGS